MAERVLLIGWDGADWGMIDPLLSAGRMPNLASLIERGVRGTLAAPRPLLTPVLWTTIATGKPAHAHGVLGHNQLWRNRRGVSPVNAHSRTLPALWDMLDGAHVIAWPVTHPVGRGSGVIVSDRYAMPSAYGLVMSEDELARAVNPPGLRATIDGLCRLRQDVDLAAVRQMIPRVAEIDAAKDRRPSTVAGVIAETMTVHGIARHVIPQHTPWELALVHFPGIERLARLFMEYHPPRMAHVSEREFSLYAAVMAGAYELHDRVLGSLIEATGADATILLVSDHGFRHDERRPNFSPSATSASHEMMAATWHKPEGIIVMSGAGAGNGRCPASVVDVGATVLALLGNAERNPIGESRLPTDARDEAERASDDAIAHLLDLGYTEPPDAETDRAVEQCEYTNAINHARSLLEDGLAAPAVQLVESWLARRPDDDTLRGLLAEARSR